MNLDKYEGHTPGPWKWAEHTGGNQLWGVSIVIDDGWTDCLNCGSIKNSLWDYTSPADMELIADAPDLLAEIKRLTTMLNIAENNIPRSIHWDCYWEALVEAGLETMEEEE